MAFRRNAAYNDPAIGQAFDNLASMFAPPKATDTLAWTKARAERENADRLSQFFTMSIDPNVDNATRDRYAIGAQAYKPTDSYENIRMKDATARYGIDVDANTKLSQTGLQQRGETERTLLQPIGMNSVRRAPQSIADMFKIPEVQTGIVELDQGKRYAMPDGGFLDGPEKPRTEAEEKGRQLANLRDQNVINPQQMAAILFGNTPLENVSTTDGPRLMTRPEAIGQQPAPDADKASPLARLQAERDAIARLNPNDPRIAEHNASIQALGRGQQQGAYDKASDESFAKLNEGIYTNAQSASSNLASLDYIQQLVDQSGGDQGKWANARLEIRKGLQALGINAGDTSPLEVQRALAARFALQLRDPSQGGGMPGAMSDADRQFLASMTPGIENSPDASRKIIDIYRRLNRRTMDLENMRREYVQKNGRVDEGFRNQVSDFVNSSPLFVTAAARSGAAPVNATPPAANVRAASSPTSSGYPEGMQIENDAGERMIRRNEQWEPL